MKHWKMAPAAAALLALGACDMKVSRDREAETANGAAAAHASAKAEEGRITIDGDGLNLSMSIPEVVRGEMKADAESGVLPPGPALTGMHVQGGKGKSRGSVDMGFTVGQPVEQVAAWYRDKARAEHFSVSSEGKEGAATVLSGSTKEGRGGFTVRLSPRGSGTEGRLTLTDKG
jgi:hypothetical protein